MPSCLGIYVEDNLIKYAKVSKEREDTKVESYGLKFFDDSLEETLAQIINETYSFKTPISINISGENYTTSDLFNLLNKKFFNKAINTEFEMFCDQTEKNKSATTMRYLETENLNDKDKVTILYSYCNKSSILAKAQATSGYRLDGVYPVPFTIANLFKFSNSSNTAIINIEDRTTVTTIVNGKINRVDQIELGMREILNIINTRENSYQKSYEICKNSTIYTLGNQNLQIEENDHMDDIMPTLFNIVEKTKEIFEANEIEIDNIYLTGLATAINNIDLYFQENFVGKSCEILAPYFANKSNLKINVKDYIEVNSAISLALQPLMNEIKGINFKKPSASEALLNVFSTGAGEKKTKVKEEKNKTINKKSKSINIKPIIKFDFGEPLDNIEKNLIRVGSGLLMLFIVYVIGEKMVVNAINNKQLQMQDLLNDTNNKISTISGYISSVNNKTSQYEEVMKQIEESNQTTTESYVSKNAIPNFLTQLMSDMPKNVQILTIANSGENITITAQAEQYQQLGYLKAALKNAGILTDITSTSGTKEGGVIKVTITGKLPY